MKVQLFYSIIAPIRKPMGSGSYVKNTSWVGEIQLELKQGSLFVDRWLPEHRLAALI